MGDSGYDVDAAKTTHKSLLVISIGLILLTNGLLVAKNIFQCDFLYKPKSMTILSLATGDILLGLFPLLVYVIMWYRDDSQAILSYTLYSTCNIYMPYLITLVYGLGLMTLGLETTQRDKISSWCQKHKIMCSVGASSFPWILGTVVVVTLELNNIDSETRWLTRNIDRTKALVVLSMILPACGAVVTSILTTVYGRSQIRVTNQQAARSNPQYVMTLDTLNTASTTASILTQQDRMSTTSDYSPRQPLMDGPHPNTEEEHEPSDEKQGPETYNLHAAHTGVLPTQPHYTRGVYYPVNHVDTFTTRSAPSVAPVTVTTFQSQKPVILFFISLVYFMLVIPLAVYYLAGQSELLSSPADFAFRSSVFWLHILRSVITPLIMLSYSDN